MLRLFLPLRCLHCDVHIDRRRSDDALATNLCPACLRIFRNLEPPPYEAIQPAENKFLQMQRPTYLFSSFTFSDADGIAQHLIHHAKYGSMMKLASVLGSETAKRLPSHISDVDHIIPVPLHRTRYAERGYNQSEHIAKGVANILGKPVAPRQYLRRIKPTSSQTGLTAEKREENVKGAFTLHPKATEAFRGKKLLLIDDVMTTGATLASAAIELDKALPAIVAVVAVSVVTELNEGI